MGPCRWALLPIYRNVYANIKNKVVKGFTQKYGLSKLMWYERQETMRSAIRGEKAMKFWLRHWKLKTIEKMDRDW